MHARCKQSGPPLAREPLCVERCRMSQQLTIHPAVLCRINEAILGPTTYNGDKDQAGKPRKPCRGVLGERRFDPLQWRCSVLDSVVGAFLTQNVTDALSSKAFMTMVAQFPAPLPPCGGILIRPLAPPCPHNPDMFSSM